MKILVTGGAGLIGHNVVVRLEELGHSVMVVDSFTNYGIIPVAELDYLIKERTAKFKTIPTQMDILSPDLESVAFNNFNPEILIHLASFPRQKVVNSNPVLGSRVMSEGLLRLLELSVKYNVGKFVYTSSSMVYGEFTNNIKEDAPCNPQGQYGILKLAGEWLIRDYGRKTGMSYTILRPSAVYGPLDVEDRVISKFMLSAMRGNILKVNGKSETLDFTYVDDAADGIVAATLSNNTCNNTYNITKSHSYSLYDAAMLAITLAGNGSIEVRNKDADFPSRGSLNIDAARRDFNFDPKVDVDIGFLHYYNWLRNSEYFKNSINM